MGCITLQRPIFHFALYYPWELSFCQRILCGNENVTHSAQSELSGRNDFFGGNFLFRISEYRRSEEVDFHFANYRFSFRKQQIFISQTTDSHFANYRFSFRKLQILILQYRFSFRFVSLHFVSQTTVSRKLGIVVAGKEKTNNEYCTMSDLWNRVKRRAVIIFEILLWWGFKF